MIKYKQSCNNQSATYFWLTQHGLCFSSRLLLSRSILVLLCSNILGCRICHKNGFFFSAALFTKSLPRILPFVRLVHSFSICLRIPRTLQSLDFVQMFPYSLPVFLNFKIFSLRVCLPLQFHSSRHTFLKISYISSKKLSLCFSPFRSSFIFFSYPAVSYL